MSHSILNFVEMEPGWSVLFLRVVMRAWGNMARGAQTWADLRGMSEKQFENDLPCKNKIFTGERLGLFKI